MAVSPLGPASHYIDVRRNTTQGLEWQPLHFVDSSSSYWKWLLDEGPSRTQFTDPRWVTWPSMTRKTFQYSVPSFLCTFVSCRLSGSNVDWPAERHSQSNRIVRRSLMSSVISHYKKEVKGAPPLIAPGNRHVASVLRGCPDVGDIHDNRTVKQSKDQSYSKCLRSLSCSCFLDTHYSKTPTFSMIGSKLPPPLPWCNILIAEGEPELSAIWCASTHWNELLSSTELHCQW